MKTGLRTHWKIPSASATGQVTAMTSTAQKIAGSVGLVQRSELTKKTKREDTSEHLISEMTRPQFSIMEIVM